MIRSVLFNLIFYLNSAVFLIVGSPLLLGPRRWAMAGLKAHALVSLWWLKIIVGTRVEVRGRERLPKGAVLIAAKHQSAWDTFALVPWLEDPALIMKAELMQIPLYGWFSRKFGMIAVRREKGPATLRRLLEDARERARAGRQIIIFPEGTRRAPGAIPNYKSGIVLLYEGLGVPCCPMALNSGLFWPRRKLDRYRGTIVVEFLEPIPPGLPRDEFKARLEIAIESASDRLLAEAAAGPHAPPLPPEAKIRLGSLRDSAATFVQDGTTAP